MFVRSFSLLSFVSLLGCGTADLDETNDPSVLTSTGGAGGSPQVSSLKRETGVGGHPTSLPGRVSGDVGGAPMVGTAGSSVQQSKPLGLAGAPGTDAVIVTAGASGQDKAGTSVDPSLKAPSGLEFVRSDAGRRVLTWQDRSATEQGFEIEYRFGTSGDFTRVAAVGADVTSWELPDLEPGQHYYRVRATSAVGKSEYSAIRGLLIIGASDDPRVPKMPSVSCFISRPEVTFSWPAADFHVDEGGCPTEANCGYRVYTRRSMDTNYSVTTVPMTATKATVSYGLIPTDYYVSVFNRFGDSGLSYVVTLE